MENSITEPSPSSFRCYGEETESENICSLMETKWYGNPHHPHPHRSSSSLYSSSSSSSSSSSLSSTCKAQELHESLALLDSSDSVLLTSLFGLLDRNRDGRVSVDEFQCLLQKLTIPDLPSDDRLTSLIRSIRPNSAESTDLDLDLDLAQFKYFYRSLFPQEVVEEEEPNKGETLTTRVKTQKRPQTLTLEEEEEEEDVLEAFRVYDRDGDGFISAWELAIVLQDLDLLPSSNHAVDTCRQLIGRVDGDGNGMVDIHEFKTMLSIGTS